ncbi:sodium-dependent noradrenaline transporter-like [Penaeus chinensis]|uniref:sodium-dependent noradrenaline transporter-like n=1 Tax=Penaeus chinensis TaxID=139456 RepID=UPI001FB7B7E9|nr:sodium-dependent noradrenaline transporter-like [Penaeus chinensis]
MHQSKSRHHRLLEIKRSAKYIFVSNIYNVYLRSRHRVQMTSSGDSLPDVDGERKERGHWSHKCDYLFTMTGYAVGLSNVWRFPYLCYLNGGGAFLVPYLLTLVLVGIPLFFLETAVGQFSSSSCLAVFSVCPAFKGKGFRACSVKTNCQARFYLITAESLRIISKKPEFNGATTEPPYILSLGMASLAINLVTLSYYIVLVSYPLLFLAHSFTWDLPWASCGNSWNSPNCTAEGDVKDSVSSADEFFHRKLLRASSGIDDLSRIEWPVVIVTFVVFVFLFFCVFKGIKILGKVVWFTAIFPFVMLFILLIRGVTLPGATDGIYFYIYPEFNRLKEMKVWAAAAIQIFYSLGPGWGSLICFGSYNKFNNRCTRDALIVPILNSGTSILAGFVVFSVLGFMAKRAGVSIEELAVAGPSLVFVVYPEALSLMPVSPLWSVLFFLMLFFLGIDACFAHIETPVLCILDEFAGLRGRRGWVTFFLCFISFLATIIFGTDGGIYWVTLVDWYCASFTVIVVCLCQICIFSYLYGAGRTVQDLQLMIGRRIGYGWWGTWLVVTPLVLLGILMNTVLNQSGAGYRGHTFPTWAQSTGWVISLVSMQFIPTYFLYYFCFRTTGSFKQRIKSCLTPSAAWGPAHPSHRDEWMQHCLKYPLRHRLLHPNLCAENSSADVFLNTL